MPGFLRFPASPRLSTYLCVLQAGWARNVGWYYTAMAYESQVSGYPRQVDCLSNDSWFAHWHYLMRSSVATAVLTSWAKPRTHVPQHSSAVAQGTGLATIMLDLDMLVQVHFPCTKHSHATYSFFEGWTPFAFEPLKKTKQNHTISS